MPIYEYRCQVCEVRFDARRPPEASSLPGPPCPDGHEPTRRLLSVFATAGRSAGSDAPPSGGCGPGCACACGA